MAGITDQCFRSFMRELGAGVVITELVSAHGIEYKSLRTLQLMAFQEDQRPIGVQLFGETPEVLALATQVVADSGADFVDLNFGCPVPKVVKKGAGSAILKDLAQVERVFRAVKAASSLPVTVKIRTGWDESSRNAEKVAEIAYNEGLEWVAIHGRTRAAGYSGLADWDFIANVKSKSKIPILGNGDIHTAERAMERLKETGCDGVMIGRGCLKNPWIFNESLELYRKDRNSRAQKLAQTHGHELGPIFSHEHVYESEIRAIPGTDGASPAPLRTESSSPLFAGSSSWETGPILSKEKDFVRLFARMKSAFLSVTDEKITMLQLKKFASWYSSGYPGASNFRKTIFQANSLEDVDQMINLFFSGLKLIVPNDTSQEAFLMGGHG